MEGASWRAEFDVNFRRDVLNNLIINALMKEWGRNSQNPNVLHKINEIAIKFEQSIFEKATSKIRRHFSLHGLQGMDAERLIVCGNRLHYNLDGDTKREEDYVAKIHQRLAHVKSKHVDALTTPTTGNQLANEMIQRQVARSYHAQQNFDETCLPLDRQSMLRSQHHSSKKPIVSSLMSMQQTHICTQAAVNGFHQDWQMGHQSAPFPNDFQHPSQQSMSIKEPFGTPYDMLNMNSSGQQALEVPNHVANCRASQMPHLISHTVVDSQEKRNQSHDITKLQGSPITPIRQSQMAAAKAPAVFSSFVESEGINDWHVLLTQFKHMVFAYLPELIKLLEKAEVQCAHAQNIEQLQKSQKARVVLGRMISFLQMTEREIIVHPKEKLIYFMNQITRFVRPIQKSDNTVSTANQVMQFSSSHAQMSNFGSPLSMDPGISCLQSSPSSMILHGSCYTVQQMDKQRLLKQSPALKGTIDHTHLKMKQNPHWVPSSSVNQASLETLLSGQSQSLPTKKDDFSMFINETSSASKQNFFKGQSSGNSHNLVLSCVPSEGRPLPAKASQPSSVCIDQEYIVSSFSNLGATSQPKTPVFTVDSPPPLAPFSVSKEIEKPCESPVIAFSAGKIGAPQNFAEASSTQYEIDVQVKVDVTPELSPGVAKDHSHVRKKPFERLIEAVQSMSREVLLSSIDEICSVGDILDRLSDVDSAGFPSYTSQAIERTTDGPVKKIRRNINSTCREASMILNGDDSSSMQLTSYLSNSTSNFSTKRPKIESNHNLKAEIRKTNQKLVETVIDVASESMSDTTTVEASTGTIVRCTYTAVALGENFRSCLASATPVAPLSIKFLVPLDYPKSPPLCLEWLPEECSKDIKDLIEKAKSRFHRCVRGLQEPVSLAEMAWIWDNCARSVLSEFALCVGGESFSSKHGSWECVPAA